mmetsp:Transcript_124532/g.240236  ORF Transcript_124532/g.240236 Transcript_124532/m.240236 type:complete len:389 (+) Transcript_124532:924-2090(+)
MLPESLIQLRYLPRVATQVFQLADQPVQQLTLWVALPAFTASRRGGSVVTGCALLHAFSASAALVHPGLLERCRYLSKGHEVAKLVVPLEAQLCERSSTHENAAERSECSGRAPRQSPERLSNGVAQQLGNSLTQRQKRAKGMRRRALEPGHVTIDVLKPRGSTPLVILVLTLIVSCAWHACLLWLDTILGADSHVHLALHAFVLLEESINLFKLRGIVRLINFNYQLPDGSDDHLLLTLALQTPRAQRLRGFMRLRRVLVPVTRRLQLHVLREVAARGKWRPQQQDVNCSNDRAIVDKELRCLQAAEPHGEALLEEARVQQVSLSIHRKRHHGSSARRRVQANQIKQRCDASQVERGCHRCCHQSHLLFDVQRALTPARRFVHWPPP